MWKRLVTRNTVIWFVVCATVLPTLVFALLWFTTPVNSWQQKQDRFEKRQQWKTEYLRGLWK